MPLMLHLHVCNNRLRFLDMQYSLFSIYMSKKEVAFLEGRL